jgi:HSP20 family protein
VGYQALGAFETEVRVVRAWPVLKELSSLRDRLNELVDNAGLDGGPGAGEPNSGPFCPAADLYEDESSVVVIVEVPGAEPSSIDLQVSGDRLRVAGRLERCDVGEGRRFVRMERPGGAFYRDFKLPVDVAVDEPSAELRRGVLTIRLPKAPHLIHRTIPIRGDRS